MVKIGPPSPNVNTLDVFEESVYANTSVKIWQVIKFLLEELQPINIEDLGSDDRKCHICTEDFTAGFHGAVRLPCGHFFGKPCIEQWLRPYGVAILSSQNEELQYGANTCPMCRQVFFPAQVKFDLLPQIKARIKVWDKAYAYAGIALSEPERLAREGLLRYVDAYPGRGLDKYYPEFSAKKSPYLPWAHLQLLEFSRMLKQFELTPVQKVLRQTLERFAKRSSRIGAFRRNMVGTTLMMVTGTTLTMVTGTTLMMVTSSEV